MNWTDAQMRSAYDLEKKQQERRKFVKKCMANIFSMYSDITWEQATKEALECWQELDKQLTELEKGERE